MCIHWTRVLYSVVITRQPNPTIHNSTVRVMNSRVSGQCLYTISHRNRVSRVVHVVIQYNVFTRTSVACLISQCIPCD